MQMARYYGEVRGRRCAYRWCFINAFVSFLYISEQRRGTMRTRGRSLLLITAVLARIFFSRLTERALKAGTYIFPFLIER